MHELSLHILDLLQNSFEAGANQVTLDIREDWHNNQLEIVVEDNGRGIPQEMIDQVTSPFVTSRSTRKFGLGLSLLRATAEGCGGRLKIDSGLGKGTRIVVTFQCDHIDLPPLGDIASTIIVFLTGRSGLRFMYRHSRDSRQFEFVTTGQEEFINSPVGLMRVKEDLQKGLAEFTRRCNL
ncbi:MAG TPA: ATP-binding protein [Candidatus Limnocylindrales bacterium]|nr:ATP-binding protein [Candidatus Limnocylindrales bacterium]